MTIWRLYGRADTVALTDDSGNVTDTKEYDAGGNVIASSTYDARHNRMSADQFRNYIDKYANPKR